MNFGQQPAFVLHLKPFKNTSALVYLFTEQSGKVAAVAHGMQRKKSALSGILRPFNRLIVDYSGKSALKTLTMAEAVTLPLRLSGVNLYSGFYINELLYRLLPDGEGSPRLFDVYVKTVDALALGENESLMLRRFEYALLENSGYAFNLKHDATGDDIKNNVHYEFNHVKGLSKVQHPHKISIEGRCLCFFASDNMTTETECLRMMRDFMRRHIDQLLEWRELKSRSLLREYLKVKDENQ